MIVSSSRASVSPPELWGRRYQLFTPANRIITVTFTTCSLCTWVVASKLQHTGLPPHCGGGERSDKQCVRQFLTAWGLQGGEGREKWNASWFFLSQLRVLLRWGVILYFLWLPGGTNALACPSRLPLYVPSVYESVCERESLRVGGREPHMWVTLSPSGSLDRL